MFGVDYSQLPAQFEPARSGRYLILDGDGYAYVAAATVKRLDTACSRLATSILARMFFAQAEYAIVHFTHRTSTKCNRGHLLTAKPYQGQRKGKAKPPLLEPLREEFMKRQHWPDKVQCVMHYVKEADDGMMQDAYLLGNEGIIDSQDKDLQLTPFMYLRNDTGVIEQSEPHGWVDLKYTPAGNPKLVGRSAMFFWAQMLMGDSADNVQGILRYNGQQCGPVLAYNVLKDVKCQHAAANLVIDGYRAINQNPLPEGMALWLHRSEADDFTQYVQQLALTPDNAAFIRDKLQEPLYREDEAEDC